MTLQTPSQCPEHYGILAVADDTNIGKKDKKKYLATL
jgi:hypothetical protein